MLPSLGLVLTSRRPVLSRKQGVCVALNEVVPFRTHTAVFIIFSPPYLF